MRFPMNGKLSYPFCCIAHGNLFALNGLDDIGNRLYIIMPFFACTLSIMQCHHANTGNINRAQTTSVQNTAWKSDKKPGQVSTGAARPTTTSARVGDAPTGSVAGSGGATRQSMQPTNASGQRAAATSANAQNTSARNSAAGGGANAFSDYGSGNAARADSSRGAASRSSMSSQGGGRSAAGSGRGRSR